MNEYQILTDSICDLPIDWLIAHPMVTVVDTPITITMPGTEALCFSGLMSPDDFTIVDKYVKDGYTAKTSLPRIYGKDDTSIESLTKNYLAEGKDVVYLAMNSAISGTFQHVHTLYLDMTKKGECPKGQKIVAIDTKCASTGLAFLLRNLFDERINRISNDSTLTATRIVNFVNENAPKVAHVFTWFDFDYIVKSGKVKALPAFLGKVLGCHPLCSAEYLNNSRPLLTISGTIRGVSRFTAKFADFVAATIADPTGTITVAHGNYPEGAELIASAITKRLPEATVLCNSEWRCGAAIQAHGGPTSIHVNYFRIPCDYAESVNIFNSLS
ncbi:DegV family EDD domain-containing protein [Candidatus Saccharibacteria bacterium]|nr:DegV family EDD domain-containing protein [Candidatus Saccharibacteria bacterium]